MVSESLVCDGIADSLFTPQCGKQLPNADGGIEVLSEANLGWHRKEVFHWPARQTVTQ